MMIHVGRARALYKFQKQYGSPWGNESFDVIQIFDILRMFVCFVGMGCSLRLADDYSYTFSLIAMVLALIALPAALYSGLTGIYPVRSRMGYYYFQQYKDPAKQFLRSAKYPELKMGEWVQFIFLITLVVLSASYLF